MFCRIDNITHNIPHIQIGHENIMWNIVSLIKFCYEFELWYAN